MYMLLCADGTLYTGWTNSLAGRLEAHNEGRGAKYTRPASRRPAKLVYAGCFATKEEAMRREYEIKQLSREEKEKLRCRQDTEGEFRMGKIFYIMGKSATGKDSIYERLLLDETLGLKPLVIYTTRPIRSGETDGVEYHFTDEAQLEKLQEEGRVVELREYDTIHGIWKYFTVDDDSIDLTKYNYLAIGTLVSFGKIAKYYGSDAVVPVYIEASDENRLARAMKRERKQAEPKYEEMCRRFLADQKDFSEAKLKKAGITVRYPNDGDRQECIDRIKAVIRMNTDGKDIQTGLQQ